MNNCAIDGEISLPPAPPAGYAGGILDVVPLYRHQLRQPPDLFNPGAGNHHAVSLQPHSSGPDPRFLPDLLRAYLAARRHGPGSVGTRIGLALAVVFWSIVNMFTGFASSVFGFAASRFLLGIGEGFNWPGPARLWPSGSPARNAAWPLQSSTAVPAWAVRGRA